MKQNRTRATTPTLAVVFWWYKSPEICLSRLALLRQQNPELPIYAVYGGPIEHYRTWDRVIKPLVDDSWCFHWDKDSEWKWRNGDQVLSYWYRDRGSFLAGDTFIIVQWDILYLAPVDQIFGDLETNDIYLPGLIPIERIEAEWCWTRPEKGEILVYKEFKKHLATTFSFNGPYMGCQFLTAALPRCFLDAYMDIQDPELGFLEYKLPAYAMIFNCRLIDIKQIEASWPFGSSRIKRPACSADRWEVSTITIALHCINPSGTRVFHPYYRKTPASKPLIALYLIIDILLIDLPRRTFNHLQIIINRFRSKPRS